MKLNNINTIIKVSAKDNTQNNQIIQNQETQKTISYLLHNPINEVTFGSKKAVSLLQVASPDKIAKDIQESGNNLMIVSDYDATFAGFVEDPLKAIPHVGNEKFLEMVENCKNKNIPFFILSSRNVDDFYTNTMFGNDAKKINLIGVKGSQIIATLPNNKSTLEFIEKNYDSEIFDIKTKDNNDNTLDVHIAPIRTNEYIEFKNAVKEKLEQFDFLIEDKYSILNLGWRKIAENNKKVYKNIDNKTFEMLKKYSCDKEQKSSKLIIVSENNEIINISKDILIDFGKAIFDKTYNDLFENRPDNKKMNRHFDNRAMFCEYINKNVGTFNKGIILEKILNIFGEEKEKYPLFMGDSFGATSDDEFAIAKVKEMSGDGIAIIQRQDGQIVDDSRKALKTDANYNLKSYKDTVGFVNSLVGKL